MTELGERTLAVPGFDDLDTTRLQFFFRAFASVLAVRPLNSFDECNDLVGTANGVASGAVANAIAALTDRGYLRRTLHSGGVELTAKGTAAANAVGPWPPDPVC